MLDENLPTFFIKPFSGSDAQNATLYLSQYGADPQPAYTLRRPDPAKEESKNCYALALFDSYNPEVLFGEVLIRPQWTQPSPSAAETRRNGNVPPPPEPVLPPEFVIHLYEPDQQVRVRQKQGSWVGSGSWEFEIPQNTFRKPSASDLDRSQTDPAAAETTPRYQFRWKKDGKLSRDLVCLLSGRSTDPAGAKKKKGGFADPDIAVALFKHLREITVYEPNLSRIEVEDPKGFEVVLLLSAAVIRDVYFGNARDAFNVSTAAMRPESVTRGERPPASPGDAQPERPGSGRPSQGPVDALNANMDVAHPMSNAISPRGRSPDQHIQQQQQQQRADEETRRLKAQLEAEQRARARAEQAEVKRIKKMLEAEEKEARRRQAEVDRETERLKKLYGDEEQRAAQQVKQQQQQQQQQQRASGLAFAPSAPLAAAAPGSARARSVPPHEAAAFGSWHGPVLSHASPAGTPGAFSRITAERPHGGGTAAAGGGAAGAATAAAGGTGQRHRMATPKKSMFGLRSRSDSSDVKLSKKRSTLF